ncbi:MAG: LytR/AlgR family response regulator transcription factor [Chitinophagaceae bacterium]
MMQLTCVVIEDDISWQLKFEMILEEIGITIMEFCNTVDSATECLTHKKPDFIIADVMLGEEKVFDVFKTNSALLDVPTIFATLSDINNDFEKANEIKNHIYLVKPFHKLSLQSAIELVCKDLLKRNNQSKQSLTVKGAYNQKIEISFDAIVYIEQNQHYSKIHTKKQNFTIKKSLSNVIKDLDDSFLQVHRSFCINKNYIQNFKPGLAFVKVYEQEIPIGYTFKEKVKTYLANTTVTDI